jgi:hypothetical protein
MVLNPKKKKAQDSWRTKNHPFGVQPLISATKMQV